MIDWLTLKINAIHLSPEAFNAVRALQSTLWLIAPDGSVTWSKPARENVRSDSHQVRVEFGSDLQISGSPARVQSGVEDNVFGSYDIRDCAHRMIQHVAVTLGVELPQIEAWACTRIDVTENFDLGEQVHVRQALEMLRHSEGGRYQVKTEAESVYWSVKSAYRSGKAYSKGQHLLYLIKKGKLVLEAEKVEAAQGLLRLELSLRRHWLQRICKKPWYSLTATDLAAEHEAYFEKLIGNCEVSEMSNLQAALIEAAKKVGYSEGCGRAAFGSWQWVRASGYADWREGMPRSTFYRHRKIMFAAGLSFADMTAGNVVAIRKRRVVLNQPVRSWAELKRVA